MTFIRHPIGRWYGRGTAENKGQHTINLAALAQVLRARIRSSDRASARFRSSDVPAWSAGPRTSSPQWCMAGVTRRQHRFY
ncbi:hypothetical protein C9I56_20110 [Paraburkholderia caribensis]|nr:hypothetical protein C2L66_29705 [Paraburkholderia caribensis]PTB26993.1 hypothetical protein C9I56_20110 [Paraburkholderia caribensis]